MTGTLAYILAKKIALSTASGIQNITLEDQTLVFHFKDGTTAQITIPLPKDGTDGFSPTVTTTPIDGGTRVTITDATGEHSFDVMDGSDSGVNNLSNAPLGVKFYEHVPKKDDYINFPMENIYGALPVAGGPLTGIVYNTEGMWVCDCKVSDDYKSGYWAAMTQVTIPPVGIDLSNYYTKNEVDSKINPTWVAYSPEEYVLDGVNDTYAMWLDNSRFSTPAAVGSYGMVIAKGQAGTDGTEAKNWIFVGEVLSPNTPIEGKTFVQVKFPLEIGSGNAANELITIKDTKITNISQLPEEPCCIHAIDSEIGFAFKDDIIYVRPLGSVVEIYTIDGSIATVNVDPDTGAFTTGGPVENWAKESEVYNKSQVYNKSEVDKKIADYLFCYSGYPPTVEIANGVTKSVITDYFIGATPTTGSFGIMIYYQGDNRYLIDFKVIAAGAEVTDVKFMSDPVQINTPDMTQYYNKDEIDQKMETTAQTWGSW